jgi:hypothetical protein
MNGHNKLDEFHKDQYGFSKVENLGIFHLEKNGFLGV